MLLKKILSKTILLGFFLNNNHNLHSTVDITSFIRQKETVKKEKKPISIFCLYFALCFFFFFFF